MSNGRFKDSVVLGYASALTASSDSNVSNERTSFSVVTESWLGPFSHTHEDSTSLRNVRFIQGVPLATEPDISLIVNNTNEDIGTKFEQEYVRCVGNEKECVCSAPNSCDTEQRSASQPASQPAR